jgi:CubicO group peptidase (beta-lactamase class C family)
VSINRRFADGRDGCSPDMGSRRASPTRWRRPSAEEVERLRKAPLAHQPGTPREYSLAVDVQGCVVEAVTGKRLAYTVDERVFKPLTMTDSGFWVPKDRMSRLAQPLAIEPALNEAVPVIDVSAPPKNDSSGASVGTRRRTVPAGRVPQPDPRR